MNASTPEQKWLGIVLAVAMENDIMDPADIILEATPEIMSANLPPDVMSKILAASLKAGTMTPDVILDTAGPQILSRHLPPDVLWKSLQTVAERAKESSDNQEGRIAWMTAILEEALQLEIMDPPHILKHTTPDVLAADLPRRLLSSVLQAGLDSGNFDTPLVVEVVEPKNLAEHLSFALLWDCIEDAAQQNLLGGGGGVIATPPPPNSLKENKESAEYDAIDDSMVEDAIALLDEVEEELDVMDVAGRPARES